MNQFFHRISYCPLLLLMADLLHLPDLQWALHSSPFFRERTSKYSLSGNSYELQVNVISLIHSFKIVGFFKYQAPQFFFKKRFTSILMSLRYLLNYLIIFILFVLNFSSILTEIIHLGLFFILNFVTLCLCVHTCMHHSLRASCGSQFFPPLMGSWG